jgi:hypothetical protein
MSLIVDRIKDVRASMPLAATRALLCDPTRAESLS